MSVALAGAEIGASGCPHIDGIWADLGAKLGTSCTDPSAFDIGGQAILAASAGVFRGGLGGGISGIKCGSGGRQPPARGLGSAKLSRS